MKTVSYIKIIFILSLVSLLFIACNSNNEKSGEQQTIEENADMSGVVEVLVLHGVKQCETCQAIKKYSKQVVDLEFPEEAKSGKVIFKIVDFSVPENKAIADSYEVAWTSLVVVNHIDKENEEFVNMGAFAIENARRNTDLFKKKLKEQIQVYLDK